MRDFECHILRRNHACGVPTNVLYLDTETKVRKEGEFDVHYMHLAWTCLTWYDKQGTEKKAVWKDWYNAEGICSYINRVCRERSTLYLFAHNAFFDLQACGFFKYFAEWGWVLDFFYEKGVTYILCIHKGTRRLKVVSSTNFFECSLKELGNMLDLPKLGVDFAAVDEESLSSYCLRDVEILKAAMENYFTFLVQNDFGKFCLSKASQAMHAFRHRFMDSKIYLHHEEGIRNLERKAYFGGRVECFQIGKLEKGPFVSLDVNSMYPYVMRQFPCPNRLVDYREGVSIDLLQQILKTFCAIARVELKTEEPIYPLRQGHKVIFPVGEFETVLCTWGLHEALERGHLRKVREVAVYQYDFLFTSFVDTLYSLRQRYMQEANPIWVYLLKKLLNSLYGKWAQRRALLDEEEEITFSGYYKDEIYDLVTGKTETEYKLFNKRFVYWGDEPDPRSFVAISAHITEAARMILWGYLTKAGLDHVLYCDTDSLKIRVEDQERYSEYIHQDSLGFLKVEKVFDAFEIFGAKSYQAGKERHIKGIPFSAQQLSERSWRYTQFYKQSSHLRHEKPVGVLTKNVVKELTGKYDKGIVTLSGKVVPFRLSLL